MNRLGKLPEEVEYEDTGCDAAPACLSCPLPRCRYEYAGGLREAVAIMKRTEIRKLVDTGASRREVAAAVGLSVRQVHRAIRATG